MIAKRINRLLEKYILPFTANQQILLQALEPQQASQIILLIAQGECWLNRVWSAASDNCLSEAQLSYAKSMIIFQQVYQKFNENF